MGGNVVKKIIVITLLMVSLFSLPVYATNGEIDQPFALTLENAYSMAVNNSNTIRQAELDVERSEKQSKYMSDRIFYTPLSASSPEGDMAFTNYAIASITEQMSKKTRSVEEEKLFVSVLNQYTAVLAAVDNHAHAEIALDNAKAQWKNASLSHTLGLISLTQRNVAESAYKMALTSYDTSKLELQRKYEDMNVALGLPIESRPVLVTIPEYVPFKVDVETEISRTLDIDPNIWQAQQSAGLATIKLNLFHFNAGTSYDAAKIDVEKAQVSASEIKRQKENYLRSTYNEIIKIENTYDTLQQDLAIAQEELNTKQAQYEVGLATKLSVQTAEAALKEKQKNLKTLVYKHEVLKIYFQKPWVAM